jgi:hypothetical protein
MSPLWMRTAPRSANVRQASLWWMCKAKRNANTFYHGAVPSRIPLCS